jgi:hypothetical protein
VIVRPGQTIETLNRFMSHSFIKSSARLASKPRCLTCTVFRVCPEPSPTISTDAQSVSS